MSRIGKYRGHVGRIWRDWMCKIPKRNYRYLMQLIINNLRFLSTTCTGFQNLTIIKSVQKQLNNERYLEFHKCFAKIKETTTASSLSFHQLLLNCFFCKQWLMSIEELYGISYALISYITCFVFTLHATCWWC